MSKKKKTRFVSNKKTRFVSNFTSFVSKIADETRERKNTGFLTFL